MPPERLAAAFARYDALNAEDPRHELVDGVPIPRELLYSQRMTACLERMFPAASEALQLAARAQHICRWRIPRSDYPMDRGGYKKWRTELLRLHADLAAQIAEEVGYDPETVARVRFLIRKRKLKQDQETQSLEDVICLVFLEHYFADFAAQHTDEKLIDIVRKTWFKMSEAGHAAALKLSFGAREGRIISAALES